MDNLAHTLAGVALAQAGFRRMSALGTATLVIGANLPDVDALSYVLGDSVDAFVIRRGWTHGILALIVLPLLLAGCMIAWDRLVRRRLYRSPEPVNPRGLFVLAAVGIWSHSLLDLVNTYGVRLMMPFSDRWFYGDTLFVIDPWVWGALALGAIISSSRRRRDVARPDRPAQIALGAVAAYMSVMAVSSQVGRSIVERQAVAGPAARTMVSPVPFNPLHRRVVRDLGTWYEIGELDWWPRPQYSARRITRKGADFPQSRAAAESEEGAAFLSWARFPRFDINAGRVQERVTITDLRYSDESGRGWASVVIPLPPEQPEWDGR
jgi:inner membrane protein